MSGPDYPPPPGSGSNAIGKFEIGVSPIGDIVPFNYWDTIISQYANSPILTTLIGDFDAWLDQTKNLDDFYDLIMNVATAQGYGLDVWGRIVGINRALSLLLGSWFGFQEAGPPLAVGFNQAQFFTGEVTTTNYVLNDQSYRTLIYAKAAANITNGSIPAINQILLNLFPHRGNCFVTEGNPPAGSFFGFEEASPLNVTGFNQTEFYTGQGIGPPGMHMTYTFKFPLTPIELAIVEQSGVLPKSTGVKASVVIDI